MGGRKWLKRAASCTTVDLGAGASVAVHRDHAGHPVIFDPEFTDLFMALTWDADLRVHIPSLSPEVASALRQRGRVVPEWVLQSRRVPLISFIGSSLFGLNRDGQGCVVPINFKHNDVRAANLAAAPGTGKSFKSKLTLEWPPEAQVVWPEGPAAGQPMRYVPRGVKVCNGARVELHYKDDAIPKTSMTDLSELGTRFRDKFVPVLGERWADVSPYAHMTAVTPETQEALSQDWLSAHAYYSRLLVEYETAVGSPGITLHDMRIVAL